MENRLLLPPLTNEVTLFTHTKKEKSFKKISAFLNVTEDLLDQQDPNLIVKMIRAADDDEMFDVHRFGMEMKGRF